jgi:hypothetical protein
MSIVVGTETMLPKVQSPLTEVELEIARMLLQFTLRMYHCSTSNNEGKGSEVDELWGKGKVTQSRRTRVEARGKEKKMERDGKTAEAAI